MKDRPAGVAANPVGLIAVALLLVTPMLAQNPDTIVYLPACSCSISKREMQLRGMEGTTPKKTTDPKKSSKPSVAHVKQDFEGAYSHFTMRSPWLSALKKRLTRVLFQARNRRNKRASRLQTTLALDQQAAAGEQNQQKLKKFDQRNMKHASYCSAKRYQLRSESSHPNARHRIRRATGQSPPRPPGCHSAQRQH